MKKLPKNVKITDGLLDKYTLSALCDSINEYLSDKYGYCVNGYNYSIEIKVDHIDWDMEE